MLERVRGMVETPDIDDEGSQTRHDFDEVADAFRACLFYRVPPPPPHTPPPPPPPPPPPGTQSFAVEALGVSGVAFAGVY